MKTRIAQRCLLLSLMVPGCIRDPLDGADILVDAVDVSSADIARPDGTEAPSQDTGTSDTGASADASEPSADASSDTASADAGPDLVAPDAASDWEVSSEAGWSLGRPLVLGAGDGSLVHLGPFVGKGEGAFVPVLTKAGSVTVDGRIFAASDEGGHAAIMVAAGELETPSVRGLAYVDGDIGQPELPGLAVCDSFVIATVNDALRQRSRLVRLSLDLQDISVAQFEAQAGLGSSVELGKPVCGGPGFVVPLDAVGGAVFTAPDGRKSQFLAEQTTGRTLMLNGAKVFSENAAQTVSANAMKIVHIARSAAQKVLYVGEATAERQIGETRIVPGDQLVYQHDFSTSTGGSIGSQGFFGRKDIKLVAAAPSGRFVVVWQDVTAPVVAGDPELVETVVSMFAADGTKGWVKRSPVWSIDAVDFVGEDVRIAGTFRSLEVLGLATITTGTEDAFLAVLDGAEGTRKRHVTFGLTALSSHLVERPFVATGTGACEASALDAVLVSTDGTTRIVGVSEDGLRCASTPIEVGSATLFTTSSRVLGGQRLWLGAAPLIDGLVPDAGPSWPAAPALLGPAFVRVETPL